MGTIKTGEWSTSYLHAVFIDHYNKIAGEYDHLFDHVYETIAAIAVKHLNLSPDDRLAEIGGGTGEVAHLIWKMAGINIFIPLISYNT